MNFTMLSGSRKVETKESDSNQNGNGVFYPNQRVEKYNGYIPPVGQVAQDNMMYFTYLPSIATDFGNPVAPTSRPQAASPPPPTERICSVCHDSLPLADFTRKSNRTLPYAYESCNSCSEKRLARLKRIEDRKAALIAAPAPYSNPRLKTPVLNANTGTKAWLGVVVGNPIANTFSLPFRANMPPAIQLPRDIATIFKTTTLPTSLLHCSSIPSIPTNEQQYIQHYALATRLSLLHNYWSRSGKNETKALRKEWYHHITLLQKTAFQYAALAPWAPLMTWLETYADTMKDDFLRVGKDNHCSPFEMATRKMKLLKQLEEVAGREKKLAKQALEEVCDEREQLERRLEKVEKDVEGFMIEKGCFEERETGFGF